MIARPAQDGVETLPRFLQTQTLVHNAPAQSVEARHLLEVRRTGLDGAHRSTAVPPVRRGDGEHQMLGKDRQIHRETKGPGNAHGIAVHTRGLRAQSQQGRAEDAQKVVDLPCAGGLRDRAEAAGTFVRGTGKRGRGRALL